MKNHKKFNIKQLFTTKHVFTTVLLFTTVCYLSSCRLTNPETLSRVISSANPSAQLQQVAQQQLIDYAKNPQQINTDLDALKQLVTQLQQTVAKLWGKKNAPVSGPKEYVKYTNNYRSRAIIDFTQGKVIVETIAKEQPKAALKSAIITTVLTPQDPSVVDLYSSQEIKFTGTPYLYGQILDQEGQGIRYQWRAQQFAEHTIKHHYQQQRQGLRIVHRVEFALINNHQQLRATHYRPYVDSAAKRYQLDRRLILAIINTESAFNPYAVSSSFAYGLMQIIPATAGRDVYEKIKKKPGQPTKADLFQPQHNIDIGSAYLYLLKNRYLTAIQHQTSQEYAIISAYNGGASNMLATFHHQKNKAINIINKTSTASVYEQLTKQHPRAESRHYLYKVIQAKKQF